VSEVTQNIHGPGPGTAGGAGRRQSQSVWKISETHGKGVNAGRKQNKSV